MKTAQFLCPSFIGNLTREVVHAGKELEGFRNWDWWTLVIKGYIDNVQLLQSNGENA